MADIITEDYVSFETAKLLREKGFEGFTMFSYSTKGTTMCGHWENEIDWMPKCTLQMAMEWLRKVHNIHIAIVPCEVGPGVMDYTYILYKVDTKNFIFKDLGIQGRVNTDKMSAPKTAEAAIRYCLENLI